MYLAVVLLKSSFSVRADVHTQYLLLVIVGIIVRVAIVVADNMSMRLTYVPDIVLRIYTG